MDNKNKLEQKVIALCSQIIRFFYSRKISDMLPFLDKDYLWIGAYSFQWAEGRDAFVKITKSEEKELPPFLSNERYQLLLQNDNIWVVCGEYTTTYQVDTDYICQDLVRVTFVWEQRGQNFILHHIHGSNAQDFPSANGRAIPAGSFFQYVKKVNPSIAAPVSAMAPASIQSEGQLLSSVPDNMLVLRDETEHYRYLLPMEILYLEASNQWCRVYTPFDSFLTFGSLTSFENSLNGFVRCHRSYLVNTKAIVKLRYSRLWLWNDTELPVSKTRYPRLKELLGKISP